MSEEVKKNFINIEGKEYSLSPKDMKEFNALMEATALVVAVSFATLTADLENDPQKRLSTFNQNLSIFDKNARAKFVTFFLPKPKKEGDA